MTTSALQLVRETLLTDASIMGEVDSIFAIKAKQGSALPYLVLDLVAEDEFLRSLSGAAGQYEARVSVAAHAASASAADYLAELVKASIGDRLNCEVFDGASPPARLGTIETWVAGASAFDWSEDGKVFRRLVDYGVRWRP
jgi:hypothetical protein